MNRRSFIQSTVRLSFLGVFAGGSVYLASRGRITTVTGKCDKTDKCLYCSDFKNCGLPEALKIKEHGYK